STACASSATSRRLPSSILLLPLNLLPSTRHAMSRKTEPALSNEASSDICFLGIDVGTGSARAGVFSARGEMLGTSSHPIAIWKDGADFVEQSSEDIWRACGRAVRGALKASGVTPDRIAGIGFDATC